MEVEREAEFKIYLLGKKLMSLTDGHLHLMVLETLSD